MPLLNYTTSIGALRTVGQIQAILIAHGAKSILLNYGGDGTIESLSFIVQTPHGEISIRLPVEANAVLRVMEGQNLTPRYANYQQAVRVAWRIVKDWVEAQMAILETEMVQMEQVFLPYIVSQDGRTLYDVMVDRHFLLREGGKD